MAYDDTKIIDGKRYTFLYYRFNKSDAQKDAKAERKKGWRVRVLKRKIGKVTYYDLYGLKQ